MHPEQDPPEGRDLFDSSDEATLAYSSGLDLDTHPGRAFPERTSLPPLLQAWDRFELRGFLGQGGMGQVFEAWDVHLQRKVALKFLHGNSPRESERLLREGRAQALIDHPHVVKIFEAGAFQDHSYLAMQFVPGRNLQELGPELPLNERLKVVAQACYGVHAAHVRGLLHQDLKPANILVEKREDGSCHAFVSDFGMAKSGMGEETGSGVLEGTPAFMSPEQLRKETLDARSDVYGLGGCLYAVLTGRPPFTSPKVYTLVRQVLDLPPVSPKVWSPDLPEDLEAITLRCLAKLPDARYPSAIALAEDLERYLAGRPVQARPVTPMTRLRKWVGRNPVVVTGALASMGLFSLGMTIQTVRVSRERTRANQQAEMAQRSLVFLKSIFDQVRPTGKQGPTITVKELLDHGRSRVDGLQDQPILQAEVQEMLGDLYVSFGMFEAAQPLMSQASRTFERLKGPKDPDFSRSINNLAIVYKAQGAYAQADPLFQRALALEEKNLGPNHLRVANILNNLGDMYTEQGRYREAVALHQRALAIWEKVLGPYHPDVALSLSNLANALDAQGLHREAEPLYRRSLAIREKALGPDHPDVAASLNNLAMVLDEQGDPLKAESLFRRALAIREKTLGPDHPAVAEGLNNLAAILIQEDKLAEAEPLLIRSLAIREKTLGPDHPEVADSLSNLANLFASQQKLRAAEPLLKRSLAIRVKALGPDHQDVAEGLLGLATLYQKTGRPRLVDPLCRRAQGILDKAFGSTDAWPADRQMQYAALEALQGRKEEALASLARAVRGEGCDPSFVTNADFAKLHADPRWQKLVNEVRNRTHGENPVQPSRP